MPILSALFQQLIKSCASTPVNQFTIGARGPTDDRLLMVTDEQYRFRTQRKEQGGFTKMALIEPRYVRTRAEEAMKLELRSLTDASFSFIDSVQLSYGLPRVMTTIFDDQCEAHDQGDGFARWLTAFLDTPSRLVRICPDYERGVDVTYSPESAQTGFADGFPILLISDASLADLNKRITAKGGKPVSRPNFRANMWVEGCEPYAEDKWKRIKIGDIEFDVVKPCARCSITQVNWTTGEYREDKEPVVTLGEYRHGNMLGFDLKGVMFGQNLVHRGVGDVHVGDEIEILETK